MGLVARGMWDLPGPGIEPMSPALAGRFLTTGPPEKSLTFLIVFFHVHKFLIWAKSNLSVFSFVAVLAVLYLRNIA